MIDPLEAAIQFLLSREELSSLNGRISGKHRYGETWSTDQASLVAVLDDSDPNWFVQVHDVRLEILCMAADDTTAMNTWLALLAISRHAGRVAVRTSNGDALVYSFLPESGPSYAPDEELDMLKRVVSFWRVRVSEVSV